MFCYFHELIQDQLFGYEGREYWMEDANLELGAETDDGNDDEVGDDDGNEIDDGLHYLKI